MTQGERGNLLSVARKREKVAKTQVDARAAELLADFERQMASKYSYNSDETWKQVMDDASKALVAADEAIKARCEELGIPAEYRPGMEMRWYDRGENAVERRQTELRRVAKSRIREITESAKHRIEAASADVQERILTSGLGEEAREALSGMPTPAQLMPLLDVIELENAVQRPTLGKGF